MRLSVILSTYNAPDWLEKTLWGYTTQSHRDFELVIADDGSTEETADRIADLQRRTGLSIQHVWHEDRGFRKCEILNKAIRAASADYLVFSDGDCIPSPHFLATHVRYAKPGHYLSGGAIRLPLELSRQITPDDIRSQRATTPAWLYRGGLPLGKQFLRLAGPRGLGTMLDAISTTKATWNGNNSSGWKADLVRVNGFDERMGYGGEDCELGERLVNLGIRPLRIRHRAILVHLDHPRGYIDDEALAWNRQHREHTRNARVTWTDYGIEPTVEPESQPATIEFPATAEPRRKAA